MNKTDQITFRITPKLRTQLESESSNKGIRLSRLITEKLIQNHAMEPYIIIGNHRISLREFKNLRVEYEK
ncbi:MAG: hypothetical protein WAR79_01255 [Melioribacteraceae bacterium]